MGSLGLKIFFFSPSCGGILMSLYIKTRYENLTEDVWFVKRNQRTFFILIGLQGSNLWPASYTTVSLKQNITLYLLLRTALGKGWEDTRRGIKLVYCWGVGGHCRTIQNFCTNTTGHDLLCDGLALQVFLLKHKKWMGADTPWSPQCTAKSGHGSTSVAKNETKLRQKQWKNKKGVVPLHCKNTVSTFYGQYQHTTSSVEVRVINI